MVLIIVGAIGINYYQCIFEGANDCFEATTKVLSKAFFGGKRTLKRYYRSIVSVEDPPVFELVSSGGDSLIDTPSISYNSFASDEEAALISTERSKGCMPKLCVGLSRPHIPKTKPPTTLRRSEHLNVREHVVDENCKCEACESGCLANNVCGL